MRTVLISAISVCAEQRFQKKARKFLQGLSINELQYIAEFLGAGVLESSRHTAASRDELADGIAQFEQVRRASAERHGDREHNMILLLEYLCRSQTHSADFSSRIQILR